MEKTDLNKFAELYNKFIEDCNRVADILKYAPEYEKDIDFADEFVLEGDDVFWEGDEYWNYGGHEYHSGTFPAEYLTMSDKELKGIVDKKIEEYNKRQEEKKRLRREAEKEARRKEYEKLRAEFGYDY